MDWLDGLFVLTSVAWLYEIWRYRNRSEPTDGASEHASFYIVSLMMVTVFAISIGLSVWTDTRQATLQRLLGLSGFIAGVSLRYWGIRQLRHQFTRHVVVRPADELVSSGPYRYRYMFDESRSLMAHPYRGENVDISLRCDVSDVGQVT